MIHWRRIWGQYRRHLIPVRGSVDGENSRDLAEDWQLLKSNKFLPEELSNFSAQFGLSNWKRHWTGTPLHEFGVKSSIRSLSQMEQDQMSIRIMGSDFATLRNATMRAAQGDSQLLDQVANKAALLSRNNSWTYARNLKQRASWLS